MAAGLLVIGNFLLYSLLIYEMSCENSSEIERPQSNMIVTDDNGDVTDENVLIVRRIYPIEPINFAQYIVSIHYTRLKGRTFAEKHICSGTIIRIQIVLTAAHCLYIMRIGAMKKNYLSVVAGTPKHGRRTEHTQIREVRKVIVHKKYRNNTRSNDICLLRLKEPFFLDKNYVALLPIVAKMHHTNDNCTVFGWGRMKKNNRTLYNILHKDVEIMHWKKCFNQSLQMPQGNICVGDKDKTEMERSPCAMESGSPLICNDALRGLVSYDFGCDNDLPDLYTDVYYFRDWIMANNAHANWIRTSQYKFFAFINIIRILIQ